MDKQKIALSVAGGGYRATLYSLGALWRLNEFGLLPRLSMITSVSGGSILIAYLAKRWNELVFDEQGVAADFEELIAAPLQQFCAQNLDVMAILKGLLSFRETIGDQVARVYDRRLYNGFTLSEISDAGPAFIFYGTSLQTGSSVRIEKAAISDYKIGRLPNPALSLARSVGISSAFPPVLSPIKLKLNPDAWKLTTMPEFKAFGADPAYRKKMVLVDGGLYDNLGLEAVWKGNHFSHVLCCDAGAPFGVKARPHSNWISQFFRMTDVMTDQQRALRKRILIERFIEKKLAGTYFGISTDIQNYAFGDSMTVDSEISGGLQHMRTRLNAFSASEQGHLINWGYALADTAVRCHAPELLSDALNVRGCWPLPDFALPNA